MKDVFYFCLLCLLFSCTTKSNQSETDKVETMNKDPKLYGVTANGDSVYQFTMRNTRGMSVDVISFGGVITSIKVPDRDGDLGDVVLGFDNLADYEQRSPYFGALIGRYGNRIANGKFSLDGYEYELATNNLGNHLHGGLIGFDKVNWQVESPHENTLLLTYRSAHMEEGYPGNLEVQVQYSLSEDNSLRIDYQASTDQPTVVNLTQHSYFNLNPQATDILSHKLTVKASHYLPVDETLIPLESMASVQGSPFDFREATSIGARIDQDHVQLQRGGGYDHCWVLDSVRSLRSVALVHEQHTGRKMEVFTTEPGIQFYSGNFLDGSAIGKDGQAYTHRSGLCLETQHFPDSPNREDFPTVRLDPGQSYECTTVYSFSVE